MTIVPISVSKVTPEGRVLIPAPIRRRLGLEPGSAVEFVVEGDSIRLLTPGMRLNNVRAQEPDQETSSQSDAAAAVRELRDADASATSARWIRGVRAAGAATEVDSAVEASLERALGLRE